MGVINIGIFGRTNTGKSSILNVFSGQNVAIVSQLPGTTTDPIRKRIEIKGLGACQLIDTAGIADDSELGGKRMEKTMDVISQIDLAILVFTANKFERYEKELLKAFRAQNLPVVVIHNQQDIVSIDESLRRELASKYNIDVVGFSCNMLDESEQRELVDYLKSRMVDALKGNTIREKPMFEGIVKPLSEDGGTVREVLLVCPIDSQAPTGRLILPQVMAIRDLLDRNAVAVVLQPEQLASYVANHPKPYLCVTDSQVFAKVASILPADYELTSFSMLLARSKGAFSDYMKGTPMISSLKDGDRVLILESCTHHASCEDIGRVKLPALFRKFTGKQLDFDVVPGLDRIGRDIRDYALVAQCGGCVVTARQLASRLAPAIAAGIPVTNYGMAIAYMTGIFDRAVRPLVSEDFQDGK